MTDQVKGKWEMGNGVVNLFKKAVYLTLYLLPFTFYPGSVYAISSNAGTSNGNFLNIPTDARGVAIGPALVSMAEGVEGMRWNPAALGVIESKELSATEILYYQDVSIQNIGFAYPLEEGGIAVNGFYLSPGSLDGRDSFGNPTGDFSFYDLVGSIGYGRRIRTQEAGMEVDAGAAIKVVQEKIADSSYQNAALDFGLIAIPLENLKLGASVRNLSTSSANFPKQILGGASYTMFHDFIGGLALTYSDDAPMRYSAGGEYRLPVAELEGTVIRAGYQSHDTLDDSIDSQIPGLRSASLAGLTMGAGLGYLPPQMKGVKLQLDYAMAPFGALGIAHTITVKVKW